MKERTLSVDKYTSSLSRLIAFVYLVFPAAYGVYMWLLFKIPASKFAQILLSPLYYFVSIWAVFVGYGIWNATRWVWYVLIPANILIAYESAVIVASYSGSDQKLLGIAFTIALLLTIMLRIRSEFRVPYMHPRIPWWEMFPGTLMDIPATVTRVTKANTPLVAGKILDINFNGSFIKTHTDFLIDEKVEVNFKLFENEVTAIGIVVWKATSTVTHPKGVGIKFFQIEKESKRRLKGILSKLRKQNRETLVNAP